MSCRRGEVYFADLGDIGRKIVVVVSPDTMNKGLEPIICLCTATERDRQFPTYVAVEPPEGGFWKPTFILCHAIRAIDEVRFDADPLGRLSTTTMQRVDEALAVALALNRD